MSDSNGKWEIGVASVYERFDNFDRRAKVGADYPAMPTTANSSDISTHPNYSATDKVYIDLDSSIATDYRESPFFLTGRLTESVSPGPHTVSVPGTMLIVGPSTDADYDGSIERCIVMEVDGTTTHRVYQEIGQTDIQQVHNALLTSAYKDGDPVIIRTIPHGWTTHSSFNAQSFGVRPIGRYYEHGSLAHLASASTGTGYPDVADYERRHGMEIYLNSATANTDRWVQYISDVNTFIPHVRRWRISWDSRVVRAHYGSTDSPSDITAKVYVAITQADGTFLFPIKKVDTTGYGDSNISESGDTGSGDLDGDGLVDLANLLKEYTSSDIGSSWASNTFRASSSPDDSGWDFNGSSDAAFLMQNRGNRWAIKIVAEKGVNTALDFDNMIIEHAHGTSDEANGYYEIDDWPDVGSVSFSEVPSLRASTRLENGSMKVSRKKTNRDRWRISADFSHVDVSIYRDLLVLMDWQEMNYPLVLRPFGTPLPKPLVGTMNVERWSPQTWDVDGKISFSMSFEEI